MATKFEAMFKRPIQSWEGGDGKQLGNWLLAGLFESPKRASAALSDARAHGWPTRIIERDPVRA